jgi:hypothetical protein
MLAHTLFRSSPLVVFHAVHAVVCVCCTCCVCSSSTWAR